jgi:hypothetical protein
MLLGLFGQRNRLAFWVTVPLGAVLLGIWTWKTGHWNPIVIVLDLLFLVYAVGMYDPQRFSVALRTVSGIFSLGLCWIFIDDFLFHRKPGHEADWLNLLHPLIFAIPAGIYAIRGSKKKKPKSNQDPYSPTPIGPT